MTTMLWNKVNPVGTKATNRRKKINHAVPPRIEAVTRQRIPRINSLPYRSGRSPEVDVCIMLQRPPSVRRNSRGLDEVAVLTLHAPIAGRQGEIIKEGTGRRDD